MDNVERGFRIRRLYWLLLIVLVIIIFAVFLSREIVIFGLTFLSLGDSSSNLYILVCWAGLSSQP